MHILLILAFSLQAYIFDYQYEHHFTREPSIGDCYPSDPITKEYHKVWGGWLYEVKIISCEYACIDNSGEEHYLRGTQKIRSYFGELGTEFVCKGFEKDMEWVETPYNNERWGYYTLGKTRPFSAVKSKMPEIKKWAKENL